MYVLAGLSKIFLPTYGLPDLDLHGKLHPSDSDPGCLSPMHCRKVLRSGDWLVIF